MRMVDKAQADLFAVSDVAVKSFPQAPALQPHEWPFPGLTPEDSARSALSRSREYSYLLAELVKKHGGPVIDKQIIQMVPDDWRATLGPWVHASLSATQAREFGLSVKYVGHDGGSSFHFEYSIDSAPAVRDKS